MSRKPPRPPLSLLHALDEAKFGSQRTLNLRSSFPTEADAVRRANAWLRERQVANVGDVLIITGRGAGSPGGVSVVREGVYRLLHSLRRRGVVASIQEHTAGSFVVELAPLSALLESPRRRREHPPRPATPTALRALTDETRELLRTLALHSLAALGIADHDQFLEQEMLRQFAMLTAPSPVAPATAAKSAMPSRASPGRRDAEVERSEAQLQRALRMAIEEHME